MKEKEMTVELSTPDGRTSGPMTVAEFRKLPEKVVKAMKAEKEFKQNRERKLITPGDPNQVFQEIPPDDEFGDTDREYIASEKIQEIGEALVANRSSDLKDKRAAYLWKRKGGSRNGRPILGKAVKPSGLVAYFCNADAIVLLSADHLRELKFTRYQVEALIFHELCHFEIAEGEIITRGHDFEEHAQVVMFYGVWNNSLVKAREVFVQLPLL